jgi:uncharacterized protein YbjT (DUF2867 family)
MHILKKWACMRYLITGATGHLGSMVVERLLGRGERPRVFVRDRAKAVQRFGHQVEISVGDLSDPHSLAEAMRGIDRIFLLTAGPDLATLDAGVAACARASGIGHVVKLSTMDVHEQNVGTGVWHARGEAAIRDSGVGFTFIQPTGFMANALAWAPAIKSEGIVRGMTGEGSIPSIHSKDIAAVTVVALTTRTYDGQSLAITGPRALSYPEMIASIAAAIGRHLAFEQISEHEERRRWSARGEDEVSIDYHLSIFRAIREGRLATVTDTVERVLGRAALTFDQWAQENAGAFR